jgi:thioesterase domain-containing protein/acyl carrier protein
MDSRVIGREDGLGGSRLVAYIVSEPGRIPELARLREFLLVRLPEYMAPAAFVFLDSLPPGANGKFDATLLPDPGETGSRPDGKGMAPRDRWEIDLLQVWEELLHRSDIGVTDDFFQIGGHSIAAVVLMDRIRRRFGITVPVSALFANPTVERLAGILRHGVTPPSGPLVPIQTGGSRLPFFCVHAMGGVVSPFVPLARFLGPDQTFYGLQASGLDPGSVPSTTIEEMAGRYVDEIVAVQKEGPYLIGGWSMGGLIAFEMARQLRSAAKTVSLLVLMDTTLPEPNCRPMHEAALVRSFAATFPESVRASAGAGEHTLDGIVAAARRAGYLPPDVDESAAERLFRVFQANVEAYYRFRPKPYEGHITFLQAGAGSRASIGWDRLANGGIDLEVLPGDHLSMLLDRTYAKETAAVLRSLIDAALVCEPHYA